ncbi:MAG: NTP transferase domain-containing protein, partial [Hamadaea sp.]|nr:NTP transferase domain-containing protein [Hamadaea sp.]
MSGVKVAGLVLAAGAGRRYGGPKAFDFLAQAVAALRDGGCDTIFAVLGAAADDVRAAVDLSGVEVVENPGWDEGMGSSLRTGLAAVAEAGGFAAVCVHLVDMPGVNGPAVARVVALAAPGRLARATFAGVPGHP